MCHVSNQNGVNFDAKAANSCKMLTDAFFVASSASDNRLHSLTVCSTTEHSSSMLSHINGSLSSSLSNAYFILLWRDTGQSIVDIVARY